MTAVRLQKIDDTNRSDHYYLTPEDECLFLYEYTAGLGWRGGATNQLIHNLQKKKGDNGYRYKSIAINDCAKALSATMHQDWTANTVSVPVPPSKIKTDPMYDDRIAQVCRAIRNPSELKVCELIEQIESTESFKGGHRLKPAELRANYRFNEELLDGLPKEIGIVDDVLTTGSHFRALKDMIIERRPGTRVVGFFIARRALANPFGDLSLEELLG